MSSEHAVGRYAGCVVQYVLYEHPPSHLVTELWIEPQYGCVSFLLFFLAVPPLFFSLAITNKDLHAE